MWHRTSVEGDVGPVLGLISEDVVSLTAASEPMGERSCYRFSVGTRMAHAVRTRRKPGGLIARGDGVQHLAFQHLGHFFALPHSLGDLMRRVFSAM